MLIVDGHSVELFQQIERDVRLPIVDGRANYPQIALHPDRLHLMAELSQRRNNVVLRSPFHRLQIMTIHMVRRDEVFVHEDEHAQSLHKATRCRPLLKKFIV